MKRLPTVVIILEEFVPDWRPAARAASLSKRPVKLLFVLCAFFLLDSNHYLLERRQMPIFSA